MYFSSAGGGRLQERIGVELQQMWREVLGIQMELRQIERKIFYNAQTRLDYDLAASSWVGDYNDANTFLDLYTSNSGNNRTGWKNARYDSLLEQANRLADIGERARLLNQAETLLVTEQLPVVPLYFYAGFTYYDATKIKGIHVNLLDEHPLQDIFKDDHRTSNSQRPTSN
jgi:oligopeptide transport system substrate-binding protein